MPFLGLCIQILAWVILVAKFDIHFVSTVLYGFLFFFFLNSAENFSRIESG